ncbi:MAG: nucleotidyl transferase AbiEii/AbiGii toxin family protein [Fibrobacteres bacterium]|nr:nucleotidyl transferase AbiEii/AbiGii toxin family protein [Fibrobacterota bacterium]
MDDIALASVSHRQSVFDIAADRMQLPPAIIEKDFWVCWLLNRLFSSEPWQHSLMFKGGTCLSKVFGLINRFSEDIDLILDWSLIDIDNKTAWEKKSRTKRDQFNEAVNHKAAQFLEKALLPWLSAGAGLPQLTGMKASMDLFDKLCINVVYPASYPTGYLNPQIRLEIGPLGDWVPHGNFSIRSYAAEYAPKAFRQPEGNVRSILAERTFWEKATILHREAHRTPDQHLPSRQARHYYDLAMLAKSSVKTRALSDNGLLTEVAKFKEQFYPCPWAKYETAKKGSLRLLPPNHNIDVLRKDYIAMQDMMFGTAPGFDEIIFILTELEQEINVQQVTT